MTHIYAIDGRGLEFEQAALRLCDSVRASAQEVDEDAKFPEASLKLLAEEGFYGLCLQEAVGGQGQTPGVFAAVVEQLAQACPSTAMVYVMHISAAQAIAASSTLANRDELLSDVSRGRHLCTLAFSERGSRSQFWAPVSQLKEDGQGGYIANAMKSWVTSANHADSFVSSTQMPAAQSPLESTLYLARSAEDAVQVSGAFNGLGLRGNDSAPVEITDLALSDGDMLTAQGAGAAMMLEVVLPWFSVGTSAMALGVARAAIAATQGHLSASGFDHTGEKLRDLPNLRARLAEMNCRCEQSRSLLGFTVQAMLAPDEQTPLYVLQSRLAALETALHVTDLAMKTCGGAAFSRHLGVEQMFRDARAGWVMAPTVDHLQEFIGRALTGLPLF